MMTRYVFILVLLLTSCSGWDPGKEKRERAANQVWAKIERKSDDRSYALQPPQRNAHDPYPWAKDRIGNHPKLTKEFFRCKGSPLSPPRTWITDSGEEEQLTDCRGSERHSLPIVDGKEFVYPILIDLLNWIQAQTGQRVVITSGHRCPVHNTYVDSSQLARTSKHMIAAEVDFYVQGREQQPDEIVQLLQDYYNANPATAVDPHLTVFERYTKEDTNVSIQPWFNKEVFIKLFQTHEGRNLDNRHLYPFISIQVRWDRDRDQRVSYSWDRAHNGYRRW